MTIADRILAPVLYKASSNEPSQPPSLPAARILACSAVDRSQQRLFALKELDRKLCEDRKTPLEHLMPKSLAKSVSGVKHDFLVDESY